MPDDSRPHLVPSKAVSFRRSLRASVGFALPFARYVGFLPPVPFAAWSTFHHTTAPDAFVRRPRCSPSLRLQPVGPYVRPPLLPDTWLDPGLTRSKTSVWHPTGTDPGPRTGRGVSSRRGGEGTGRAGLVRTREFFLRRDERGRGARARRRGRDGRTRARVEASWQTSTHIRADRKRKMRRTCDGGRTRTTPSSHDRASRECDARTRLPLRPAPLRARFASTCPSSCVSFLQTEPATMSAVLSLRRRASSCDERAVVHLQTRSDVCARVQPRAPATCDERHATSLAASKSVRIRQAVHDDVGRACCEPQQERRGEREDETKAAHVRGRRMGVRRRRRSHLRAPASAFRGRTGARRGLVSNAPAKDRLARLWMRRIRSRADVRSKMDLRHLGTSFPSQLGRSRACHGRVSHLARVLRTQTQAWIARHRRRRSRRARVACGWKGDVLWKSHHRRSRNMLRSQR
mmetsp:Transcript_9682/g.58524  ORF Transcript_9682/g.58524 Transcript_9682/m.58524 type:complete len:461 (+) Transcript_9682:595-1977(+)